jgi:hemerythrin
MDILLEKLVKLTYSDIDDISNTEEVESLLFRFYKYMREVSYSNSDEYHKSISDVISTVEEYNMLIDKYKEKYLNLEKKSLFHWWLFNHDQIDTRSIRNRDFIISVTIFSN